jgi:HEPN domain-containing protein
LSSVGTQDAAPWFRQAASDLRTAQALLQQPEPMYPVDVGCHVAALCSQTVEKSIKGYLLLNRVTPRLGHRPDGYLRRLLDQSILQYEQHHSHLSKLFEPQTKDTVRRLLELTPGGQGHRTDVLNTEYPWQQQGQWQHAPIDAGELSDGPSLDLWLRVAQRVHDKLRALWSAADRGG